MSLTTMMDPALMMSSLDSNSFESLELKLNSSISSSITGKSKQHIDSIIENVKALTDVEKIYLYLQLPTGSYSQEPFGKQKCGNPFGKKADAEVAQTYTWIQSHLEEDASISLPKHEVYDEYRQFCQLNQIDPLCVADFGKAMKHIFPNVKPRRLGQRGNSRYCYSGLRKKGCILAPELPDLYGESMPDTRQITFRCDNCNRCLIQETLLDLPTPESSIGTSAALNGALVSDVSTSTIESGSTNERNLQRLCSLIILDWTRKHFGREFLSIRDLTKYLVINGCVESETVAALSALCSSSSVDSADLSLINEKVDSNRTNGKESVAGGKKKMSEVGLNRRGPKSKKLIRSISENFQSNNESYDRKLNLADVKEEPDEINEFGSSSSSCKATSESIVGSESNEMMPVSCGKSRRNSGRLPVMRSHSVIETNSAFSFADISSDLPADLDSTVDHNNNLKRRHSTSVLLQQNAPNSIWPDTSFQHASEVDSIDDAKVTNSLTFKKRFIPNQSCSVQANGLTSVYASTNELDQACQGQPNVSYGSFENVKIYQLRKMLEMNLPQSYTSDREGRGDPIRMNSEAISGMRSDTMDFEAYKECHASSLSLSDPSTMMMNTTTVNRGNESSPLSMFDANRLDQNQCAHMPGQVHSMPPSPGANSKSYSYRSFVDLSYNYGPVTSESNVDSTRLNSIVSSETPSPFVSPRSTPISFNRSRNNSGQTSSLQYRSVNESTGGDSKFVLPQNGSQSLRLRSTNGVSSANGSLIRSSTKTLNRARHSSGPGHSLAVSSASSASSSSSFSACTFSASSSSSPSASSASSSASQMQALHCTSRPYLNGTCDIYRLTSELARTNSHGYGTLNLPQSTSFLALGLDKNQRSKQVAAGHGHKNSVSFGGFRTTPSSPFSEPLSPSCAMFNDASHSLDNFACSTTNDPINVHEFAANCTLTGAKMNGNAFLPANTRMRHLSSPYTNAHTPVTPTSQLDVPAAGQPTVDCKKAKTTDGLADTLACVPSLNAQYSYSAQKAPNNKPTNGYHFPLSPPPSDKLYAKTNKSGPVMNYGSAVVPAVPWNTSTMQLSPTGLTATAAYPAVADQPAALQDDLQATIEDLRDCDNEFSQFTQDWDEQLNVTNHS